MTLRPSDLRLGQLGDALSQATERIRAMAQPLTPAQLEWKPDPAEWSAAQVFEHLTLVNDAIIRPIEARLAGRSPSLFERVPLLPALTGWGIRRTMDLLVSSGVALRAPRTLTPTALPDGVRVRDRFLSRQQQIVALVARCAERDIGGQGIGIPGVPLLCYTVSDALHVMLFHEGVHLGQLAALIQHPELPHD